MFNYNFITNTSFSSKTTKLQSRVGRKRVGGCHFVNVNTTSSASYLDGYTNVKLAATRATNCSCTSQRGPSLNLFKRLTLT